MKIVSVFIFVIILCACNSNANKNIMDSKHEDNIDYFYFGNKNTVDSVLGIDNKSKKTVSKTLYQDGQPIHSIHFYGSNKIKEEAFILDGCIDIEKNIFSERLIISYDSEGFISEYGIQGRYNGNGVPIGTWHFYKKGKLIQTRYYHNDTLGADYILYKNFEDTNGFKEYKTNNFVLYNNDSLLLP